MLRLCFASAKIERLRKEGSTQLEEQRELLRKQVAEELRLSKSRNCTQPAVFEVTGATYMEDWV